MARQQLNGDGYHHPAVAAVLISIDSRTVRRSLLTNAARSGAAGALRKEMFVAASPHSRCHSCDKRLTCGPNQPLDKFCLPSDSHRARIGEMATISIEELAVDFGSASYPIAEKVVERNNLYVGLQGNLI